MDTARRLIWALLMTAVVCAVMLAPLFPQASFPAYQRLGTAVHQARAVLFVFIASGKEIPRRRWQDQGTVQVKAGHLDTELGSVGPLELRSYGEQASRSPTRSRRP